MATKTDLMEFCEGLFETLDEKLGAMEKNQLSEEAAAEFLNELYEELADLLGYELEEDDPEGEEE